MKKTNSYKKTRLVLGIVMSSLVMVTLGVSSFAYWQKDKVEVTIPTYDFNATEQEFIYYACVPNVASTTGYDYYDLDSIPVDLVDRVTSLAVVRFEALTKTAYIPSYPEVLIKGNRINRASKKLPVTHILNSLSYNETSIDNGFLHIETLIIPETVTYIQPGSFSQSTSLTEVTILGEENNSGYLSVDNNEFGEANVYKQWENRTTNPNYILDTEKLKFSQFGDSFEYDNMTGEYYTFVVTGSNNIEGGAIMDNSPALNANTKYKLTYDGSSLEATPYTYKINIGSETTNLMLNTSVNYEEYILPPAMEGEKATTHHVVRLTSHPVVEVEEYIGANVNMDVNATFDLNKLNAYYSLDNTVFEIKYAPSHVYESIHYSGLEDNLVEEKTMSQISAEKAYFLNKVNGEVDAIVVENESIVTVTVPNNQYLGLYVKATFGNGKTYTDKTQTTDVISMDLIENGTKYQYVFKGSNNPTDIGTSVAPSDYTFYLGKHSVVTAPEYIISNKTREQVESLLEIPTHNTTRVYLQLYKDSTVTNSTITSEDHSGLYKWYIVYWTEKGEQKYFRVYYSDVNSTIIMADIPDEADHFKFVRIGKDKELENCLWNDFANASKDDLKISEFNLYVFESFTGDYFSVTNNSNLYTKNAPNTKRVFLDLTDNLSDVVADDHNGLYKWYVVYWTKAGKQCYVRAYYTNNTSSRILLADIPNDCDHFKFVRIEKDKDVTNNVWQNFTNAFQDDIMYNEENNYYTWSGWTNSGYFTVVGSKNDSVNDEFLHNEIRYGFKNKNYLVITNYGETSSTERYIALDENLGYQAKELDLNDGNSTYDLEFCKYEDFVSRNVQSMLLPAGTILSAKMENVSVTGKKAAYFNDATVKDINSVVVYEHDQEGNPVKLTASDFFEVYNNNSVNTQNNGKVVVKKDVIAEVYLRVTYNENADSNATTPNKYEWHFVIKNEIDSSQFEDYGLNRTVVADISKSSSEASSNKVIESNNAGKKVYPWLETQNKVVKLDRNHANTDYEEYRIVSSNSLKGSYVISPYYESERSFGGNTGSVYYGTINGTTPSGEIIMGADDNVIMFTPNGEFSYEEKHYAAFDEYGTFLANLTFNRTQTINEGYQVLSVVIPESLSDFRYVYIYEVDENGKKIGEPLNTLSSIIDILGDYNLENGYDKNHESYKGVDIPGANDVRLLFDYYLKLILPKSAEEDQETATPEYRTNSIGFSTGIADNGDTLYYYYNVPLTIHTENDKLNSGPRYQILTSTNFTKGISIYNEHETYGLDEDIIDGYYYNNLDVQGEDQYIIRFRDIKNFKDGYYNLVLRKRTVIVEGKNKDLFYLGYQYLGPEDAQSAEYYLYTYDVTVTGENENQVVTVGELKDIIKMDAMDNGNHYFADVHFTDDLFIKVYNQQKVLVYSGSVYSSTEDKISRFYFGVNTEISNEKLKQVELDKMYLNFNFGTHPLNYDKTYDGSNIRYSTTIYESQSDYYQVKVDTLASTEIYTITDERSNVLGSLKKYGSVYSTYIVNTEFNKQLYLSLNGEKVNLDIKRLPQPGTYLVSYNSSVNAVSCYKVQEPDVVYLYINGNLITELEVNPEQNDYYEYYAENHIILETKLDLTKDDVKIMSSSDGLGYVVAEIEKVTVNSESLTEIAAGAYTLTYSVDSSRRIDDVYHVFTYLNFDSTKISSTTLIYHYDTQIGTEEEPVLKDNKIIETIINDGKWKFEIYDFEKIVGAHVPVGTYFVGWATEGSKEVEYYVGQEYSYSGNERLVLYPVFDDLSTRHKVIWIKEPDFDSSGFAIFSLTNMEKTKITGVSYAGYDEYVEEYVKWDKNESSRVVTVNQSLFEVIGYVEGGIKLVCHLLDDYGKTSTCTVRIDYPNYDNRQPIESKYSSQFTSSEYDAATNVKTGIINSKDGKALSWDVVNGAVVEKNPTDEPNIENNYSLRLRTKVNDVASATALSIFNNIKKIELSLYFMSAATKSKLTINILDLDKSTIVYTESFEGVNNNKEVIVSCNVPSLKGRYYIQFVASSTSDDNVFVHIDNLSITIGSSSYTTSFSSNDYSNMGSYTTEEKLVNGRNINALNWTLYHSRFTYNNADNSNNNGQEDKSNLALAIEYEFDQSGNQVLGYARLEYGFTSINKISFTSYQEQGTIQLKLSILQKLDNDSYVEVPDCSTTFSSNTDKQYKSYLYDNLNLTNGEYYIQFSVVVNGGNASTNLRIDNLKIEF